MQLCFILVIAAFFGNDKTQASDAAPTASVSGSYRARIELLENTFRPIEQRSDHLLASRLLLHGKVESGPYRAGFELQDSRAFWFQPHTPLGTDDVNALEPLQAYVGANVTTHRLDGELDLVVGRFTLNAGSRRLLARNNFRNTSNAFTGASARLPLGGSWDSRLRLRFDAASGDVDPDDGRSERFDKLFGARAFELGPSGFYGLLTRSNLVSPGAVLELRPSRDVDLKLGYRAAWLESRRDVLPGAGLGDSSGASGRFIGHQWELSVRWDIHKNALTLETGATYLDKGEFLNSAPGSPMTDATVYGYTQATYAF